MILQHHHRLRSDASGIGLQEGQKFCRRGHASCQPGIRLPEVMHPKPLGKLHIFHAIVRRPQHQRNCLLADDVAQSTEECKKQKQLKNHGKAARHGFDVAFPVKLLHLAVHLVGIVGIAFFQAFHLRAQIGHHPRILALLDIQRQNNDTDSQRDQQDDDGIVMDKFKHPLYNHKNSVGYKVVTQKPQITFLLIYGTGSYPPL